MSAASVDVTPRTATPETPAALLIEQLIPRPDAVRAEHRLVDGDVASVYALVREADFMRAWRESTAVSALFAARALGERAASALRGRPAPAAAEADVMRLADMPTRGEWVLLGERPPSEIAFGVVGRFWAGETKWEEIDASDFATWDRPGFARIAANFSVRSYGADRSLVSYECRTQATDEPSRRAFLRYWSALSPFIGVVMRSMLGVIEGDARARGTSP